MEMEASIMDGPKRRCGAVSGLTTVKNPISLARLVMDKSPHSYLAFSGAEEFARQQVSFRFPKFSLFNIETAEIPSINKADFFNTFDWGSCRAWRWCAMTISSPKKTWECLN